MKLFEQLTKEQQAEAVGRAETTLRSLVKDGILTSDKSLSSHMIRKVAVAAAEIAFYPESGDEIMYGIADRSLTLTDIRG